MAEKDSDKEKSSSGGNPSSLVVSDQEQDLAQAALAGITSTGVFLFKYTQVWIF